MSRRRPPHSREDDGRASRRYHDRVAGVYDDAYGTPWWEHHDKLVWEFIKPLLPADRPARALDLGCGTGKWGQKLAKSGFAVTFVDSSPKMIDQAQTRAAELNLKNCDYLVADICALSSLPDAACHFAVALDDPFCLCRDAGAAARELARLG
ncbi:MAG TPA: class I SAM-dependent methyltransferase [bacterium]|nr:class I SAM-dependent methyltransferase [bacterium]